MLKLRAATVVEIDRPQPPDSSPAGAADAVDGGAEQTLTVELRGQEGERRPAIVDTALLGRAEVGDEVIVNTQALDLGLGSGGFDIVHVNLTRGLDGEGSADANVMKLNYTSLQHAVLPVDDERLEIPVERPVAVLALHGQLAAVAWAFAQRKPGRQAGLRADLWRGAARWALAHRAHAAPARAAGRPRDGGRRVRRRRRGGEHRRRASPWPAHARLGRRGVRSRAGHRGLQLGAGARRHGGAGLGARGAGAGLPHAAGGPHVLQRRSRPATAGSPTTR